MDGSPSVCSTRRRSSACSCSTAAAGPRRRGADPRRLLARRRPRARAYREGAGLRAVRGEGTRPRARDAATGLQQFWTTCPARPRTSRATCSARHKVRRDTRSYSRPSVAATSTASEARGNEWRIAHRRGSTIGASLERSPRNIHTTRSTRPGAAAGGTVPVGYRGAVDPLAPESGRSRVLAIRLSLTCLLLVLAFAAFAQDAQARPPPRRRLRRGRRGRELIVQVATVARGRSALDSPVPIDLLSRRTLAHPAP